MVAVFLLRNGWEKVDSSRGGLTFYYKQAAHGEMEILLPNSREIASYHQLLNDAVRMYSEFENQQNELTVQEIQNIDKDLHSFRIINSSDQSAPILLVNKILSSAETMFKDALEYERKHYDYKNKPDEEKEFLSSIDIKDEYLYHCRLRHTWKGSFGLTIETPLLMPSIGLFDDVPDTLGRKVTNRIVRSYGIVSNAVKEHSYSYILDNIENDTGKITLFRSFPGLIEHLRNNKIEISVAFSPLLKIDKSIEEYRKIEINQNTIALLQRALEEISKNEKIETIKLVGFPKILKASRKDLSDDNLFRSRIVTVEGFAEGIGKINLTFDLPLEAYQKAVRAHETLRSVVAVCKIKKHKKRWQVIDLLDFELFSS